MFRVLLLGMAIGLAISLFTDRAHLSALEKIVYVEKCE